MLGSVPLSGRREWYSKRFRCWKCSSVSGNSIWPLVVVDIIPGAAVEAEAKAEAAG